MLELLDIQKYNFWIEHFINIYQTSVESLSVYNTCLTRNKLFKRCIRTL